MSLSNVEKRSYSRILLIKSDDPHSKYAIILNALKNFHLGNITIALDNIEVAVKEKLYLSLTIKAMMYFDDRSLNYSIEKGLISLKSGMKNADPLSLILSGLFYRNGYLYNRNIKYEYECYQLLESLNYLLFDENNSVTINYSFLNKEGEDIRGAIISYMSSYYELVIDRLVEIYSSCGPYEDQQKSVAYAQLGYKMSLPYSSAKYAYYLIKGIGMKEDTDAGLKLLQTLLKNKNSEAYCVLSVLHFEGEYVEQSFSLALHYAKLACQDSYHNGEFLLSEYYLSFETQDYQKSIEFVEKAAIHGNVKAMHNLGIHHLQGVIAKKDISEAIYWFKKASSNLFYPSDLALAQIYLNPSYYEIDEQDSTIFAKYYQELAKTHGLNARIDYYSKL